MRRIDDNSFLSLGFPKLMMTHLQVKNSGLPAGKFLKRMQHPAVNPEALRVGENITIYGRTYHICSCDEFSRVSNSRALHGEH